MTEKNSYWLELKQKSIAKRQQIEERYGIDLEKALHLADTDEADRATQNYRYALEIAELDLRIANSHLLLIEADDLGVDRPSKVYQGDCWEYVTESEGGQHEILSGYGTASLGQALSQARTERRRELESNELRQSSKRSSQIAVLSLCVAIAAAIGSPVVSTLLNAWWPTGVTLIEDAP